MLADNPFYPSLDTHEIGPLSKRYGMKVWQSYLENKTSKAMRMYWVYGPDQKDITIIGILRTEKKAHMNVYRCLVYRADRQQPFQIYKIVDFAVKNSCCFPGFFSVLPCQDPGRRKSADVIRRGWKEFVPGWQGCLARFQ